MKNKIYNLIYDNINEFKGKIKEKLKEFLENFEEDKKREELSKEIVPLLEESNNPIAKEIVELKDYLEKRSIWIVGGDGWAYDIGFGGLDHIFANRENVNILVLDTEVYSNTGGQSSKASQIGSIAKFTASGKKTNKRFSCNCYELWSCLCCTSKYGSRLQSTNSSNKRSRRI